MVSHKLIISAFTAVAFITVDGKRQCKTKRSTSSISHSATTPNGVSSTPSKSGSSSMTASVTITPTTPGTSASDSASLSITPSTTPTTFLSTTGTEIGTGISSVISSSSLSTPVESPSSFFSTTPPSTTSLTTFLSITTTPSATSSSSASTTLSTSAAPTATNLVLNPSFETGEIFPWEVISGAPYASVQLGNGPVSGYRSDHYFLAALAPAVTDNGNSVTVQQTVSGLDPSKTYRFTYAVGLGVNQNYDEFNTYDVSVFLNGVRINGYFFGYPNLNPAGSWYTSEDFIEPTSSSVIISFTFKTNSGSVDGLLDDIYITELPS